MSQRSQDKMESKKPIHTVVLDSGPILKNEPAVSSLLGQSEALITVPSVIAEIRDINARSRLETTLLPFLTQREPQPESLRVVAEFARKTGDYEVLSRTDLQVLALAYEVECERNEGDWRLRRVPGQKRVNGACPKTVSTSQDGEPQPEPSQTVSNEAQQDHLSEQQHPPTLEGAENVQDGLQQEPEVAKEAAEPGSTQPGLSSDTLTGPVEALHLSESPPEAIENENEDHPSEPTAEGIPVPEAEEEESSDKGWITPSNLRRHQKRDLDPSSSTKRTSTKTSPKPTMQVATLTTDFAMQNVLLQMNLNLISASFQQIRHLRTYILRCHACFEKTKEMTKQFCPRCGQPTLTRVSCSTSASGEFKLHLKKNMQWNTRGDRFSIPKPVGGSANGRVNVGGGGKGGGKGGWGQELILAEDQKEYVHAAKVEGRKKDGNVRELWDEDYLPGILSGERGRTMGGGRPKIGAGRDVNSRRRR